MGMIRLPVHFGNKNKFRSLEVDFLVVDVPTTYNVIIGRPALHRVKAVGTGGYASGSPSPSCSSPLDAAASASKGSVASDKLHLLRVASLRSSPLTLVHKAQVSLKITVIFKLARKGQHNLAEVFEGAGAALPVHLEPLTAPLVLGDESLQPSAFCNGFTPRANTSAIAISSSDTLGGSEAPGAIKSQDLTWTKESLTLGSALIKLVEGRAMREEVLPATGLLPLWKESGAPAEQGFVPRTTGFSAGERPACWSSLPSLARGLRPRSCQVVPRSSTSCGLKNSQRASSRRVQERAPAGKSLVSVLRKTKGGKANKGYILYVFGLLGNKKLPLFLLLTLGSSRHLFRSGIPGLEHHQPGPRLYRDDQVPLEKFLRIKRPAAARKKSLAKNFSLRSQFNSSRSLDLLLLFSGPFTYSIA
ncbi:LOW QUALITY PROTEIN: hypothetical protein Cgig2_032916 [Carnegiea gigantea]|uniref:Uncharacterized protein n=1 Tax=Carnegiea gigantea TaxID=171969 RepID=A0A9Q1QA57_9CARY|nr:LOW QUALITY PROTEIN: hypothetical protein Cgig2_032916 [Carnegiea gigantea]